MVDVGTLSNGRVLVVTPHSDDETLGCGGTIARLVAAGADVGVLLVSTADTRHYGSSRGQVSAATRSHEFDAAMSVLGVSRTATLFPNSEHHMRLDTMPRRQLVTALETETALAMNTFEPNTVLFPARSYNQDHEAVHDAVITACRPHLPNDKPFIHTVLSYEQPQLGWGPTTFRPSVYVDISNHLEQKLDAYRQYRSQLHSEPHHASPENLERIARVRGSEVSIHAAEAFENHRMLL